MVGGDVSIQIYIHPADGYQTLVAYVCCIFRCARYMHWSIRGFNIETSLRLYENLERSDDLVHGLSMNTYRTIHGNKTSDYSRHQS